MNVLKALVAATCLAVGFSLPHAATAQIVTQDFKFFTSGYSDQLLNGNQVPPVDPLDGELIVTYDTAQGAKLTLGSSPDISEVFVSAPFSNPSLALDWSLAGTAGASPGIGTLTITDSVSTDFILQWLPGFVFQDASYQVEGSDNFVPASGSIVVTTISSPAPEPGAWAMFLLGMACVGATLRATRNGSVAELLNHR